MKELDTLTARGGRDTDGAVRAGARWIQLESAGIFAGNDSSPSPSSSSAPSAPNPPLPLRPHPPVAEDELLALRGTGACVLDLSGGVVRRGAGGRGSGVARVARDKAEVRGDKAEVEGKGGAVHLVHGKDVAGAVVGRFEAVGGRDGFAGVRLVGFDHGLGGGRGWSMSGGLWS